MSKSSYIKDAPFLELTEDRGDPEAAIEWHFRPGLYGGRHDAFSMSMQRAHPDDLITDEAYDEVPGHDPKPASIFRVW